MADAQRKNPPTSTDAIEQTANLPIYVVGFMHILALVGFSYVYDARLFLLLLPLHWLAVGLGISVGFHRSIAHRAIEFKAPVEAALTLIGSLAMQGGPITWSATHRNHHRFTEDFGDPHDANRGFVWAHIMWMFYKNPNGFSYYRAKQASNDLTDRRVLKFFEDHYLKINIGFALLALGICWATHHMSIWWVVFPIRIVVSWHLTWLTNSYAHLGFRAHRTKKEASTLVNSPTLAFFNFGEGWHKNHHDDQSNYNFGTSKWQIDPGYLFIESSKALGLTKKRQKNS